MASTALIGYNDGMLAKKTLTSFVQVKSPEHSASLRRALAMQAIEENPLDAEQIEMFAMFERENWPHDKRRAYLSGRLIRK